MERVRTMNRKNRFKIATLALIVVLFALGVFGVNANANKADANLGAAMPLVMKNWEFQAPLPTSRPTATVSPDKFPLTGILDDFNRPDQGPPPGPNWDIVQVGHSVKNNQAVGTQVNDILSAWNKGAWSNLEGYLTIKSDPDEGVFSIYILQDYHTVALEDGYEVWFDTRAGYDVLHMVRVDNQQEMQLGALIDISKIGQGDSIGFRLRDGNLMAYWKPSGGSWTLLGTRTDHTYSGPFYLVPETWSTTSIFDDFGGGGI